MTTETQQREGAKDKVTAIRCDHPEYTLREIGELTGVSRERVRQILESAQLPTRSLGRPSLPWTEKRVITQPTVAQREQFLAVKRLWQQGKNLEQIAELLSISSFRVEMYLKNHYEKFGADPNHVLRTELKMYWHGVRNLRMHQYIGRVPVNVAKMLESTGRKIQHGEL